MKKSVLSTLHVLILHESSDTAEQMINSLRNAGHATRAHHISQDDELTDLLSEKPWDMLLARPGTDFLKGEELILCIQKLEKDIPCIMLLDDKETDQINEFLKLGAEDAIPQSDQERLQLVVNREIKNLSNRRNMRDSERAIKETEKRSNQLLDHSKDAISYIIDGMHVYANQAYIEKFHFEDKDDVEITPIMDLISSQDKNSFKSFLKTESEEEIQSIELKALTIDKQEFKTTLVIAQAEYDGEPCIQIKIPAMDENPELQQQLETYKNQDMVTGLPNQHVFRNVLDKSVERAAKNNGNYALFTIKIDSFNKTKAKIGVMESDLLLGKIAEKIQTYFPEPNFIARLDADTFSAINYDQDINTAVEYADKIRIKISEEFFDVADQSIQLTISIGIAFINEISTDGDVILNKAYEACLLAYEDQKAGNEVNLFVPPSPKKNLEQINVSQTLQDAMDNGRLKVLYQPIISLSDDTEESYEVFMRLLDKDQKEISLVDYLEGISMDEIGEKIDRWIILQAVKSLSQEYRKEKTTKLFINITIRTLLDKTFVPWLSVALKAARLPSQSLVFQVSEPEAISHMNQTASFSKELSVIGCKFAIKHFGCSLNPLTIVQHINVDYLKVDKSFIDNLSSSENKDILLGLIENIHEREKKLIIPFIETVSVLSNIWQLGVDYMQGYYFQEPKETMDYDFSSEDD